MRAALPLFILVAATAWAQEPETTIRSNTRLVEVEVVVRAKGKPVDDLKAADFTVLDQGKPQRIAAFAVRRADAQPTTQPLPEGEISNRLNRLGEEPANATVILFDTLNSDPEDLAETRRQLLIYLGRADPQERLALYSLNKTLKVVQDFTDDPERLRQMVKRWKTEASVDENAGSLVNDLPITGDAITDAMVQNAAKEMLDNANLRRAETTANALQLIAQHLAGLPGRKKLIWAGAAFSARTTDQRSRNGVALIETRNYDEYITRSVRALNEAHVAVYPIDPRNPYKGGLLASGLETMNLFAGGTGGRAFYAISDIATAFQEAVNDSEITYALGFYPDGSKLDGKFHNLKVKVARDGMEVRARKGYLAGDDSTPKTSDRAKMLKAAMETPLDSTGIALSALLVRSTAVPGSHEAVLRIAAQELMLATERLKDGTLVWTSLITITTFMPEHPKPNGTSSDLKLTFTEARLKEVLKTGYRLRLLVDGQGQPGPVRIAVQDRSNGKTGSLTLTLPGPA